jgi:hypothetical protein
MVSKKSTHLIAEITAIEINSPSTDITYSRFYDVILLSLMFFIDF